MRTKRTKEHEEGEGDDPKVHGVDHVATIKLGGEGETGVRQLS